MHNIRLVLCANYETNVFKKCIDTAFHLIKCSLNSLFMHLLGKKILKLEEERVLKVETLSQLFNTLFQILYLFPIHLGFCFISVILDTFWYKWVRSKIWINGFLLRWLHFFMMQRPVYFLRHYNLWYF